MTKTKVALGGLATTTDDELIALVLNGLKTGKSLDNYNYIIKDFAKSIEGASIGDALRDLCSSSKRARILAEGYQDYLVRRGLSPTSIGPRISVLKSVLKKARLAGISDAYLDLSPPRPAPRRSAQDTAGRGWLTKIIDTLEAEPKAIQGKSLESVTRARARDLAIVRLLYPRALWPREIEALDLADVDLEAATIKVGEDTLPLPPVTLTAMKAWIEVRGGWEGPLFTREDSQAKLRTRLTAHRISLMIHTLVRRAGIDSKVMAVDLRNAAIAEAREDGRSLAELKSLVRSRDTGRPVPRVTTLRARERRIAEPCVVLIGPTEPPLVRGKPKKRLSFAQYNVVRSLLNAGQEGLSKSELDERSGHVQAHVILRKLKKADPDWDWAVEFPGAKGGKYRIRFV